MGSTIAYYRCAIGAALSIRQSPMEPIAVSFGVDEKSPNARRILIVDTIRCAKVSPN
jgi:hypothetical protein